MAWAMQTIGWADVGDVRQANKHLHRQLKFVRNSFQVGLWLFRFSAFRVVCHELRGQKKIRTSIVCLCNPSVST